MHQLFFELIRVALGTQTSLSRLPSADEWDELFELAKKQSLVGITFVGLLKLGADADEGFARIGMSEETFLIWMDMAARIQIRNDEINLQCAKVQKILGEAGLESCILKGQGVSVYYGDISSFRQSGDIDVWVLPIPDESWEDVFHRLMKFAKGVLPEVEYTDKHVCLNVFSETEVELHYIPAKLNSPFANRKLGAWLRSYVGKTIKDERLGFATPLLEFNLVYLLLHMFEHVMYEGIGLRQMMDYFFVLRASRVSKVSKFQEVSSTIESLGLKRFAQGVMYVMQTVFGMKEDELICKADSEMGERLLSEIMVGGNFGHYGNEEVSNSHGNKVAFFWARMRHNLRFVLDFPSEVLWSPWYMVKHHVWKKNMNKKYAI